jgi:hypothetical protein
MQGTTAQGADVGHVLHNIPATCAPLGYFFDESISLHFKVMWVFIYLLSFVD